MCKKDGRCAKMKRVFFTLAEGFVYEGYFEAIKGIVELNKE